MGDHFVLLVDRLLTESTLEAALESQNLSKPELSVDESIHKSISSEEDIEASSTPRKVVECRICQDEGFDSNMEAPCSCSGSLKYAHRRCVQRWCNEKGDTTCEICHQQFRPGYTAPPPLFRIGGLQMNLRGHWQVTGRDPNNPRIITVVSSDRNIISTGYNDELTVDTSRSILWCRLFAMIVMVLLILKHTLPVMVSRAGNYSTPFIMLLMLRIAGIILPVCIILKAMTSILRRRQRQANVAISSTDEEVGSITLQRPRFITVR